MNNKEIQSLLEELLQEEGYGNPLYIGTDDKGEKYRAALSEAIKQIENDEL